MELRLGSRLSISDKRKIDVKKLDKNQYLISLLQECLRKGIITSADMIDIQSNIMELLKELIMKYTKGESTSVTVEITEGLLSSLLYSLDFSLLKFDNPMEALLSLKERGVKGVYEEGIELIRLCVIDTKRLYQRTNKNKLHLEIDAYNESLDVAIPSFFEKYTVIFEAHNTMASIDYPLVFDDTKVRGISYIKNYLEVLNLETEFCRLYSEEDIRKTISGFGRMCRLNSGIELINIFEIVTNKSIFSVLCGNNAKDLNITKNQYKTLEEKFKLIGLDLVSGLIDKAIEVIITDLKISNIILINYINKYKELLKIRLLNALENNCLNSIVAVDENEEEKFVFAFDEGKRMNENNFRLTVDKIIRASVVADKVDIVISNVHSLQDFIDILGSDCFFGEEFLLLFNTLEDIELTILTKLVFYEELRDRLKDLSAIAVSKSEAETEWKNYFVEFIKCLGKEKKDKIQQLIDKVDYEEIKFY